MCVHRISRLEMHKSRSDKGSEKRLLMPTSISEHAGSRPAGRLHHANKRPNVRFCQKPTFKGRGGNGRKVPGPAVRRTFSTNTNGRKAFGIVCQAADRLEWNAERPLRQAGRRLSIGVTQRGSRS